MKLLTKRKLNAMSVGADVFVSGEHSSFAKTHGNGARRRSMPLNSILRRMAQKLLHDPISRKPKVDRRLSRLTQEQVREIRRLYISTPINALAAMFNISPSYAEQIGRGETHKYVV